ncbi:BTAD domain-containing putative transcriptional regulator [Cryptosporangium japonicum]|uniref:OmpR/PhoB-type domain-containing protein n=1 Tax=Cryptosporangium japonicum TaxID=80872 RepID=A0ABN0TWY3_9ACTN
MDVDGAEPALRFAALGPLRIWRGGQALDLGPGKQRAVLAVLLLEANRAVPAQRIVEAVWDDDPPENGANVVQKYVAGLRRVLEPERSPRTPSQVLTLGDGGYRLHVGEYDVQTFQNRVRRAETLRRSDDTPGAAAELRRGLELWRGVPIAGLAGRWFDARRQQLGDQYAAAWESLAELELELGRHAGLTTELGRLVNEYPGREGLRAALMLALYRSGRQVEALAAYRDAQDHLREEFGVDPGDHLRELHQQILSSDPALSPTTATTPTTATAPAAATTPAMATAPTPPPAEQPLSPVPEAPFPAPPPVSPALAFPPPAHAYPPVSPPPVYPPPTAPPPATQWHPIGAPTATRPVYAAPPYPAMPPPPPTPTPTTDGRALFGGIKAALLTLVAILTVGHATFLIIGHIGMRRRSILNLLAAVVYAAATVGLWIALITIPTEYSEVDSPWTVWDWFILSGFVGPPILGAVHVFALVLHDESSRRTVDRAAVISGQMDRERALQIVTHHPEMARDLRIGRPDLPRWFADGGLIDVNGVPEYVLSQIAGLSIEQAGRIIADRFVRGPYTSVYDLTCRHPDLRLNVAALHRFVALVVPSNSTT